MGLDNTIEKLDKYFKRLENGRVQKIKPSHVDKVIDKLEAKAELLLVELSEANTETKKRRLQNKLEMVREQQDRARWLKDNISNP